MLRRVVVHLPAIRSLQNVQERHPSVPTLFTVGRGTSAQTACLPMYPGGIFLYMPPYVPGYGRVSFPSSLVYYPGMVGTPLVYYPGMYHPIYTRWYTLLYTPGYTTHPTVTAVHGPSMQSEYSDNALGSRREKALGGKLS